ncbi:YCF48-related protein [Marinobacterium sp. YM272]|uniref:YCF48-related protein n=1 Tax=Marinobacterium sp. YM272 TaxID=3421654 RepID=UPI003D7FA644
MTAGLALSLLSPSLAQATAPSVLEQPARMTSIAQRAVLLGLAEAGERLVAVGERGVILLSDDNGENWRQVPVPVSVTLTDVQFVDAEYGWAIGHAGVVLATRDGGESWELQLDGTEAIEIEHSAAQRSGDEQRLSNAELLVQDGPDKPFLSLHFSDRQHGMIGGAYGLAFRTEDGGESWSSMVGDLPNDWGAHIYAITRNGDSLYLAGEQGLFIRSLDGGKHFDKIDVGYPGSLFTLLTPSPGEVLVGGLRGTVLESRDTGYTFAPLSNPIPVSINAALSNESGGDSGYLFANQAGHILRLLGDGRLIPVADAHQPLTDLVRAANGKLVGVGFNGPSLVETKRKAAGE